MFYYVLNLVKALDDIDIVEPPGQFRIRFHPDHGNIIGVVVTSFAVDDGFYYSDADILSVVFLLSFGVCTLWTDYINNDALDN